MPSPTRSYEEDYKYAQRRPPQRRPSRQGGTGNGDSGGGGGGRSGERNGGGEPTRRASSAQQPSRGSPSRRQSITEKLRNSWNARRQEQPSLSRQASTASSTNPIGSIRSWIQICDNKHHGHCSNGPGPTASGAGGDAPATRRPLWLIDCVEKRLVHAGADDPYVALSYVWGPRGRFTLQTLISNVEQFQERIPEDDIPETIIDAMWVTRKINMRFLWVDRFCFVHDDEREKDDHIRNMGYIYANAHLTIVAASGDAQSGLTALDTKPSKAAGGTPVISHFDRLFSSRWVRRAWTLQEGLYSRRAVYFFQDAITWECHCEVWPADAAAQTNGGGAAAKLKMLASGVRRPSSSQRCVSRLAPAALGYYHNPWPDLEEYAVIASDYSARKLTYVDETLRAFSGITTILSKVFAGGFVYGLPVMFLDAALLWQPQASIRRRVVPFRGTQQNSLPSWSWMGWFYDGVSVDLTLWRTAADYVDSTPPARKGHSTRRFQGRNHFRLRGLIDWHITDNEGHTMALASDGLRYRGRSFKRGAADLPSGWARDGHEFVHDSDDQTIFRYPIPVPELTGPGQLLPPPDPPGVFLSFNTTRGYFDVELDGQKHVRGRSNPPVAIGRLLSRSGKWIGLLRSHDSWLGIQGCNYDGDEKVELIAISASSERGGSDVFDEDFVREHAAAATAAAGTNPRAGNAPGGAADGVVLEYVNVLWIERVAGVSYRRGLGHVLLRAWEAMAKDKVDILLG